MVNNDDFVEARSGEGSYRVVSHIPLVTLGDGRERGRLHIPLINDGERDRLSGRSRSRSRIEARDWIIGAAIVGSTVAQILYGALHK
jgi:hypothetical protein